ncbi:MAG: DNA mismatch repair endonuclease MutL [Opitutales bacterium]|nr:DNA mismatch repair endonuclease MutL [Opitutales bacterium]
MGRILKLPDHVANQIAAGEVVERPVAVVKELVENALDADARSVEVEFRRGGKAYIRVADDGTGMDAEDARACLERHATSKIRDARDLLRVGSFGFRGEALPSIASVSKFRLRTRLRGAGEGIEITMSGGVAPSAQSCGMPEGTVVEVAHLFNTVPARRKFLKTDRTEAAHIVHLCRLLAVAHPEVGFTLVEDGRTVFQSPACESREARVAEVFGRRTAGDLMPVEGASAEGWRMDGLVALPGRGRSTRAEMACYVNRRPVDSRLLNFALIESYHTYLPRGRYPVAFLFLDVPSDIVDVNVHPAKREVRFRDEGAVRRFVMEALLARLRDAARKPLDRAVPADRGEQPGAGSGTDSASAGPPAPRPTAAPPPSAGNPKPTTDSPSAVPSPRREIPPEPHSARSSPAASPAPAPEPASAPPAKDSSGGRRTGWRLIGSLHERFALWETREGLVLMHVQAAWERVWFEDILRNLRSSGAIRQGLLFPVLMELDPVASDLMEAVAPLFEGMGFEVEPFGRHVFRLSAVPDWFSPEEGEGFLRDALALMRERGWSSPEGDDVRTGVARLAARRAAQRMARVERDAVDALLPRLLACRDPLVDTRGRATFVEYRSGELERRFGIRADSAPSAARG